jgi:hypothetical protein
LTQNDFLELARRIKADYFPEWDAENAWVFECVDDCNGAVGLAVYKEKKIKATQTSREKLPLLLIHEICHAACHKRDPGHGKHWQNRMLKAARDAEHKYGDLPLAAALRNEVEGYQRSSRLQGSGRNILYSRLRDAVDDIIDHCQSLDELLGRYEQIEEYVRRESGMAQQDFREWVPRAPKVFEKYARGAWQERERVAKFKKM